MAGENEFFRPIREIEQRRVVSCSADDALVDIVALGFDAGIRLAERLGTENHLHIDLDTGGSVVVPPPPPARGGGAAPA